jgi:hypothetical protein
VKVVAEEPGKSKQKAESLDPEVDEDYPKFILQPML